MSHIQTVKVIASVLIIGGCLAFGSTVLASVYEWLDGGTLQNLRTGSSIFAPGSDALTFMVGDVLRSKYRISTSAPYMEYRSAFLYGDPPAGRAPIYFEVPECRESGVVSGSALGACDITMTSSTVFQTGKLRVTTNYAGCGSYTPTPSSECGDVLEFTLVHP